MDKDLNLRDLLQAMKSKIALILAVTIICGVGAYAYFSATNTPKYSASARLLCSSIATGTADSSLGQSAINASAMLAKTVMSLISSDAFLQEVAANLKADYPNITSRSIASNLVVNQVDDTFILIVTATSELADQSVAIVNEVGNVAEKLPEYLDGGKVSKFEEESQIMRPRGPIDSRLGLKSLLAAVVGLVASIVLVVIMYMADDKIKNQQDLLNKYNVPVVGIIPSRSER